MLYYYIIFIFIIYLIIYNYLIEIHNFEFYDYSSYKFLESFLLLSNLLIFRIIKKYEISNFFNKYTSFYNDVQLLQFKQQESNEVQKHKKRSRQTDFNAKRL